ncbi:MAG: hypothetical protein IJU52_07420 [Clostridia bacterium]|nr:hypothetical protein [Clostridia bacterium]
MKEQTLPSYASIWGDTHFPPVDNQGAIGSCASQAIMRNQFSNAVSRLIHEKDPASDFCPRDNFGDAFTPKYSYNIVGPGTAWVYEFLTFHGALPQTEGIFEKADTGRPGVLGGSIPRDRDGKRCPASTSFLVKKGQMEKALRYRLKGFDQRWFTKPPYNEKLTTSPEGRALLARIKEAIVAGEAVVTGGYLGRWVYTDVTGCGNLGKKGERVCVAAAGNGGGGHQVTIVGYDDGITAQFAGVRLQGAFLIANSYGDGWMNGGLVWMMYDAVNTVSEYGALNDPALYSGPMHLTPADKPKMFPPSLTKENQTLRFIRDGSFTVEGKEYPAFRICDPSTGKYLTYAPEAKDRAVTLTEDGARRFVPVPYEEIVAFPGVDKQYEKEEYRGSYWIYAVDKEGAPGGFCVLDAGVSFTASGRDCSLATHNGARYPEAKSWLLDSYSPSGFDGRLTIAAGKDARSERIWTLDQFCFIDRHKDVAIGMPERYVRCTVSATDRDCFRIYVTRRSKKSGHVRKFLPAMFRYNNSRPFFGERKKGDYMNFDGILDGGACEGELAFSLEPLYGGRNGAFDDYIWGLELRKGRSGRATVTEASLCDGGMNVLSAITSPFRKARFE